ncbi:hypothetical protein EPD60_00320 [Flaviaesturariibacter flavus]|uniref:Peptidase C39 domain-containing protein n=1 Tax=Flaviaesturariibacter flavus TaxID=2502780 RepID=A0A4R1BPJ2_9BACT|nr:vitamin K epoxide reductase family protein [Flaviaesturariibacter flavus]TCJ19603.1 hypothetical protein EPD60_00320 [Flaviaesturariibacter flavus]
MRLARLLEKKSSSNVSEATLQLLKKLKIPVTASSAIEKVEGHPDFPSLYSISDSLNTWKVANAAIEVDPQTLDQLPTPFIAHVNRGGGSFVMVNNVNGTVDFFNERGRKEHLSREEFLKNWTNTALLAEKNELSGEEKYASRKRKELLSGLRAPLICGAGLLLFVLFAILANANAAGHAMTALLFTKLLGCSATVLLLWFEVDKTNPLLQQICSGTNKTSCTAVLGSRGAKVFNWLSWSEIGFCYFTGSFLALALASTSALALLSWINLLALPYTVYSVYYQWRVAKQWCPLCLAIQALLVTEAITCYFGYWNNGKSFHLPSYQAQFTILTSFLLPALFWVASKKAYFDAQAGKHFKKELNKFKYNKEVFAALLHRQKKIAGSTEGLGLSLGNPDAEHTLVKVCNPFCGPCANAHKHIDALLATGRVNVRIIFTAADAENDISRVIKHFLTVQELDNEAALVQALDHWYGSPRKEYPAFAKARPLQEFPFPLGEKLNDMKNWCDQNAIMFTPTFFVNGYQLPAAYRIEDLNHLL